MRRAFALAGLRRDLDVYLKDNCQAWALKPDGGYQRIKRGPHEKAINAQSELLSMYAAGPAATV